jgi:outer membrane protein assembly factor BamB
LIVAPIRGRKQVIYFSALALLGVEVENGQQLWRVPLRTDARRHAATPIVSGNEVVVNSHTFGTICFEIKESNGSWTAVEKWRNQHEKINISTLVLEKGALYGQGAGSYLVCLDFASGGVKWQQPGFGDKYTACLTDGATILAQTSRGELVALDANPAAYHELGRMQICGDNWSHPAFANGRLYVREGLTSGWKLSCFDSTSRRSGRN